MPRSLSLADIETIARVCHENNRATQEYLGEPVNPPWDEAPGWMHTSVIAGVHGALDGNSPAQSHESWMAARAADGWIYGPVKDEETRQHPCMVPYVALPAEQKLKDAQFVTIVRTLAGRLGTGE